MDKLLTEAYQRLTVGSPWNPLIDERLPRLLVCLFSGASLACSGAVMQSLFRNPLASPSVLGCTFGASFFVSLVFASNLQLSFPFLVSIAGILGCLISLFIVYAMSHKNNLLNLNVLILSGIAVSTVFISMQNVLIYQLKENWHLMQTITEWSNGQTHDLNWTHVHLQAPLTIIGLAVCLRYTKELNLLATGEEEARVLGVNVEQVRFRLLLASSLLIGGTVASCGIISFFGLILPHILRKLFGSNNRYLIPSSIFGGAFTFAGLDLILRIGKIQAFSIGNISAVFGGIFFLFLLYQQKQESIYEC
jgi:iron complex transport system permease protein